MTATRCGGDDDATIASTDSDHNADNGPENVGGIAKIVQHHDDAKAAAFIVKNRIELAESMLDTIRAAETGSDAFSADGDFVDERNDGVDGQFTNSDASGNNINDVDADVNSDAYLRQILSDPSNYAGVYDTTTIADDDEAFDDVYGTTFRGVGVDINDDESYCNRMEAWGSVKPIGTGLYDVDGCDGGDNGGAGGGGDVVYLPTPLRRCLHDSGISSPTPVQQLLVTAVQRGNTHAHAYTSPTAPTDAYANLLATAQTGTGKTLSYRE